MSRSPIDIDALARYKDLFDEGDDSSHEMSVLIKTFLDNTPPMLAKLRLAALARDASTLYHVAHNLKGSSAIVGAIHLSYLCAELEHMGRECVLDDVADTIAQLEAEFTRVEEAFPAVVHFITSASPSDAADTE